jgi:D-sedoheptulose 7-phosphate isomerase
MDLKSLLKNISSVNEKDLVKLKNVIEAHENIIILGNGGSNAVSCHIAEDYTKVLGKKAICFGDSARMSCYANDYGWDHAYVKFIEHMLQHDTLVVLISSSGNSQNIVNCAEYCVQKNIPMVTMSGFKSENKLRTRYGKNSILHFWIDSCDYGVVECSHEIILHSLV